MSDGQVIVTMRHVRASRLCAKGARAFFSRHGLYWSAFLDGGISADVIEATGDAMAVKVAQLARAEECGCGR